MKENLQRWKVPAMDSKKLKSGLLLVASIALIALGLYRGELDVVFSKAINICLECIGIG